ncbi:MAG: type II toxin-antitoxin system death-on-curing family toxin [Microcoleus sp.]
MVEKASAIGFALIKNHPFLDGNKRIGHAAMEVFLILNGFEISAPVEEQEPIILQVASSAIARDEFTEWLRSHKNSSVSGKLRVFRPERETTRVVLTTVNPLAGWRVWLPSGFSLASNVSFAKVIKAC